MLNPKHLAAFIFFTMQVFLLAAQPCTVNLGNNISVCSGQGTTLTAVVTGNSGVVTYTWTANPGPNPAGTTASISVSPTVATTYTVFVNGANCANVSDSVRVSINPNPNVPNASANPNTPRCSGTPISFSVGNTQPGVTYSWNFGDVTTGSGASTSHTYNAAGNGNASFNAVVTATFSGTNCSSSSAPVAIQVLRRPQAILVDLENVPEFVSCTGGNFNLLVGDNAPDTYSNYTINWGDGTPNYVSATPPSNVTGVAHTYTVTGYNTITYTVSNSNNCTTSSMYSVFNGTNPKVGLNNPGGTTGLCAPQTISFPISLDSIISNPPGTIYVFSVNDGTPPDTFQHPPPANYTHTFSNSSCGFQSFSYGNAFYVTMRAINPCQSSASTVEPITTNAVPKADFTISPDTVACTGQTVTFTNTSFGGGFINAQSQCDSARIGNWIITPNTGFTISSGSLGNNPPSVNITSTWGSNTLGVQFTTPGTYSIKLRIRGKNNCGFDSIIKTVCIQAPPVPSFTATPVVGCAPLVVDFTNTSTGLNQCTGTTYLWTVTKTSFTCATDSVQEWAFVSGTSQFSVNPRIRFNNQGVYSVTLRLTNKCTPVTSAPTVITVRRKPIVSLTIPALPICAGESITPSATVQNCDTPIVSYNWTFQGGTASTPTQQNPGSVTFPTGGTKAVTLAVQNACGITSAAGSVTVNVPSVANAGLDSTVCLNAPNVQLTGTPANGSWSGPNVNTNGVFTPSQAGSVTLFYTVGSGNCVGRDSMTMRVNPLPNLTVTPPTSICRGDSVALTASGANTYSWSPTTGLTPTSGPNVISKPTSSVSYTITGTNTTTQCSATIGTSVTINNPPVVTVPPTQTLCNQPIPVTLTGSPSGGVWSGPNVTSGGVFTPITTGTFDVVYTYTDANNCTGKDTSTINVVNPTAANAGRDSTVCVNAPNVQLTGLPAGGTWSGSAFVTSTGLFTPSQAGPYDLVYSYGTGSCLKDDTMRLTVNPTPSATIQPTNPAYCAGGSTILTSTGGDTYTWSPTAGLNTATGATVTANPTTTTPYTVTVSYNSTGCSASATVTVTVRQPPVVSAGPDSSLCNQSIPVVFVGTPNGGSWSGQHISSGGVFTANGTGTFPIVYSFTDGFGCSNTDTVQVTVVNADTIAMQPDTAICHNTGAIQLYATPAGGSWSGTSLVSSTGVFTPSQIGPVNVIYSYGSGTCLKRDSMTVTVNALPNVSITPSTTICGDSSVTLTATGANTYTWNPTAGLNTGTGATVIATPATTTTYTVTGVNTTNGCTNSNTTTISVNPLPKLLNTDTAQIICSGDPLAIVFQSSLNGTTYNWSTPGNVNLTGYTQTGTSGSITSAGLINSTNAAQVLTYTVIPTTLDCDGSAQTFSITVNPRPVISIAPVAQSFCSGGSSTPILISSNIPGTNIIWTGASNNIAGAVLNGTGNSIPAQTLFNTSLQADSAFVRYAITSSVGGCAGADTSAIILVNPKPITDFGLNPNTGCSPLSVSVSTNALTFGNPDSLIYIWGDGTPNTVLYPNPIQPVWSNVSHTFVNATFNTVSFTIGVKAVNACGDTTVYHSVTVKPNTVDAFFAPSAITGCEPLTVIFADLSTGSSDTRWCFDYNSQLNACNGNPVITNPRDTVSYTYTAGIHTVALYISDNCSRDTAFGTITVSPSPVIGFTAGSPACVEAPITFTGTAAGVTGTFLTAYDWQFGDGDSLSGLVVNHAYLSPGSYNVCFKVTASDQCTSTVCDSVNVLVKPVVDFTGYDTCINTQPVTFAATGGIFYAWDFGDSNTSALANPQHQFTSAGTFVVTVIGSNATCADTIRKSFTMHPTPTAAFSFPVPYLCGVPVQVQMADGSSGALGYAWDFGNNTYSTNTNPVATYSNPGTYSISLAVSNVFRCFDTTRRSIDIYPLPVIESVAIDPASGCAPQTITVTTIAQDATLYSWDFGDGSISLPAASNSLTHTYYDTGSYTVTARVLSILDCGDTLALTDTVHVHITPIADFEAIVNTTVEPIDGNVHFVNTSQHAETYLWDFADGTYSNQKDTSHHYANVNDFFVTLHAYNRYCEDSITKKVEVFKRSLWVPNAIKPEFIGGDGQARIWKPKGVGLHSYKAQVFNTWGELLWESDKLENTQPAEGWDGTYKGVICPQDVYVWKIVAVFLDGTPWLGMNYGEGKKTIGDITLTR